MRTRLLLLCGVLGGVICVVLTGCLHVTRQPRAPGPGDAPLTVVTWNVNFGLAGDSAAAQALDAATGDADLVLLQETNATWEAAVSGPLRRRFPYQRWLDDAAAGGQAVLSRRPFVVREIVAAPTGWFPALRVEAQTPLGVVQVLSVHLHPPVSDDGSWWWGSLSTSPLRRREVETFTATLAPGLPTLVVGDFNEGTSGDAVRWLEQQGLRSVLPEYAPAAKTWHWPVGSLELRAQLDHVAYDRALAPLDAKVLPLGRSDHYPVRAIFVRARDGEVMGPVPSGTSLSVGSASGEG